MMRNSILCTLMLLPVFFLACSSVDEEKIQADVDAVQQRLAEYTEKANAEDVAALMDFYTEDAEVIKPDDGVLNGKEEIRAWLKELFRDHKAIFKNTSKAIVVRDDKAYDRGIYEVNLISDKGEGKDIKAGWYLYIWQEQPDGGWKIAKQSWTEPPVSDVDEEDMTS